MLAWQSVCNAARRIFSLPVVQQRFPIHTHTHSRAASQTCGLRLVCFGLDLTQADLQTVRYLRYKTVHVHVFIIIVQYSFRVRLPRSSDVGTISLFIRETLCSATRAGSSNP